MSLTKVSKSVVSKERFTFLMSLRSSGIFSVATSELADSPDAAVSATISGASISVYISISALFFDADLAANILDPASASSIGMPASAI